MERYEQLRFVKSKAGHDKNKVYVIISSDHEYVYLVDGDKRKLSLPKRKKLMHIQSINYIDNDLVLKFNSTKKVADEEIKRAIKLYELKITSNLGGGICQNQML